ncbi:WD repeat-containing 63 [Labeo rohita]|uniref:WD repeat-containing 63 n=1 Tax=Labeo rohita TaxID=84645 RepID=A0A498LU60_LABRO|nr:WD repeat-containing 63 [Labeo rohita]
MSSKRPKSKEASKIKGKGHPDYIFPLVLTSATQELFGCQADEDVTGENPYKLLKKEDIIKDMKTRASVSDFSPVKQLVLDYPEDELLLVFDRDFTYGQSFYLVLTVEAKENILKLRYKISPLQRRCGAPVCFSDRSAQDGKEGFVECPSYQDKSFSIREMEKHTAIQASSDTKNSSTQTLWKHPKNIWTQYEPREFSLEEKEHHLRSKNLKNFITSVLIRFEISLQQNYITDVFCDDWTALCEDEGALTGKTETQLKEYQSFMDLHFSKEKTISHVHWHPTISGVIAVAMTERLSLEERIDNSTKLLLNPSYILFWNFTDPINPQLQLECPDDVLCFQFCPSDPNIIAGGCMNGQIVLWDISAHVERLQDTRSGGKNISNKLDKNETPVVRYCAVSGIENGHKAPITDIQWLPETFELGSSGEYSPLKFSLRDNTVDCPSGDKPLQNAEREEGCGFAQLRVPSAKQQKPMENISTKLYVGTEDGELVYTDWKMEKDNDSGRLLKVEFLECFLSGTKPIHRFLVHDTLVNTVTRSPFFKDIILTVGSFSFAIWKEGVTNGPILMSAFSRTMRTVGHWSLSRPAVFFIGKEDGSIEIWDLLQNTHEPSQSQNISSAAITCIRTSCISSKQHLLAVSDRLGTLHILQIPWTLRRSSNSEELVMPLKQEEELEAEALKEYEQFLALEKDILKNMGLLNETEDSSDM